LNINPFLLSRLMSSRFFLSYLALWRLSKKRTTKMGGLSSKLRSWSEVYCRVLSVHSRVTLTIS
jgi:hypothetical protein